MSLKDTMPFVEPPEDPTLNLLWNEETPPWLVTDLPRPKFALSLTLRVSTETKASSRGTRNLVKDLNRLQAEKFRDLLVAGYKPNKAAEMLKTTVTKLMEKPDTKKLLKKTIEEFTLNADVRKLLQRALVNKGVLENSTEEGDKKLLIEYLKMLGADTEVGINAPPKTEVSIGISPALKEILDRTVPLPALPEPAIDVEFEDVPKKD